MRKAVLHHLEHHDGKNPTQHTGVIEAGNPLHDGTRTWTSINSAFAQEGLGLKNTGFKSLSDFCKRDPSVKEKTKTKLTLNTVREAILYHLGKHDGKNPNVHTGMIEAGNPLHDGKRTWMSINAAFVHQGMGLKGTGFKSLPDFCKKDPAIKEKTKKKTKIKIKLALDTVRKALLYHIEKHDGKNPNVHTGMIEAGNPLHDGKRTWSSLNSAFAKQGLGLEGTGFKSLSDFCKRDPAIKEKTKVKTKLALDTVRKAVLYHIEKHDGKKPNTHTGIIEAGNPLHDGKRTWFSLNTAFVTKRLDMKYTVFKSLFDFCRRDQDIQKFILDRKSVKNKFNYAALIETMVAHTNETKSQPDTLDRTPIQHGPLANGILTWPNVACALHKNDKRLRQATDAAPTELNTLFEQAVLTRPDVIKHFSLPLPAEMREDQIPQRSKGRRTTSSAPAGDFTVIVTFR